MTNLKESIKVDLKTIQLTEEARKIYEEIVQGQQDGFITFVNYLNQYINGLKEQGIISQFLKFYARIKATNSALKNYDEKKDLDDIFGIEFICATNEEIEILQHALEPILRTNKVKTHDKANGYKATHHLCSIKKESKEVLKKRMKEIESNKIPAMEVQYKTIEVYYAAVFGTASHEKYKDTQLPQLQTLYDSGKLQIGTDIPHMWISKADAEDARKLSMEETLKKMYPSLQLRRQDICEQTRKVLENN